MSIGSLVGIQAVGLPPCRCVLSEGPVDYSPIIVPSEFVAAIGHSYLPLTRGTMYVHEGETDPGFQKIEVHVTHEMREVLGVACIVVRDRVWTDGELVEDMAETIALAALANAPYSDYTGCLQTMEWTPLEPRALGHKFYAPGIGTAKETVVRDGWGEIELIDIIAA